MIHLHQYSFVWCVQFPGRANQPTSRLARSAMLGVLKADYVRTARAKGLREHVVVIKHAFRNGLLPIVTLGALLFGAFDAFQVRLQTDIGGLVPGQLFLMAPYVLSIVALVIAARRSQAPRALLAPWFKGQR